MLGPIGQGELAVGGGERRVRGVPLGERGGERREPRPFGEKLAAHDPGREARGAPLQEADDRVDGREVAIRVRREGAQRRRGRRSPGERGPHPGEPIAREETQK